MKSFQSIFEAIGEEKINQLAATFYKGVADNPDLRRLYPEDELPEAERRLRLFLIQVFGGPATYSEERGHPRLRLRHMQWPIDGNLRNQWINTMFDSLDQLDLDQEVRESMMEYFVKVANHMVNHA